MTVPIWLQNTVEVEWLRTRTVNTQQSPFSGDVWQSANLDTRWQARITYAEMTRAEAAPLLAAIAAQRDGLGTFGLFDPDFGVPQSGFSGIGSIAVAPAPSSTLLQTTGWTPSTLLCLPGDKLWLDQPDGKLRMAEVVAAASSDGSGNATIQIDEPFTAPALVGYGVGFSWLFALALGRFGLPMRLVSHQRQSLPGARFRIAIEAEERV